LTRSLPDDGPLNIARQRPYGDRVRWIEGDASRLGTPDADLAIMTGHVAQFFLTDESWQAALSALFARSARIPIVILDAAGA